MCMPLQVQESQIKCYACNKHFVSEVERDNHMMECGAVPGRPFVCNLCEKTFREKIKRDEHFIRVIIYWYIAVIHCPLKQYSVLQ